MIYYKNVKNIHPVNSTGIRILKNMGILPLPLDQGERPGFT